MARIRRAGSIAVAVAAVLAAAAVIAGLGARRHADSAEPPPPVAATHSAGPTGAYRGHSVLNQMIRARLFRRDARFRLETYLPDRRVAIYTGGWTGENGGEVFAYVRPSALNGLLFKGLVARFAHDLAAACEEILPPGVAFAREDLDPAFVAHLEQACRWPDPSAQRDEVLLALWRDVVAFDAPWDEFLAWRDFALGPDVAKRPPGEALPMLFEAMLLQPHVLLEP